MYNNLCNMFQLKKYVICSFIIHCIDFFFFEKNKIIHFKIWVRLAHRAV